MLRVPTLSVKVVVNKRKVVLNVVVNSIVTPVPVLCKLIYFKRKRIQIRMGNTENMDLFSDTEKKINKGWGKAETAEAEAAKDTLNPADPDAPEQESAAPVEEEEQVKTLEEYLAEKANKSLKVSLPEARKANDADESAFKGTVAFAKEEFEEFYVSKESKTSKKTTEKTRKEKVFVDIEQRFQEKSRPEFRKNDRRGGRGGNKNNNGRRAPKANNGPAVNLQDASAFPTLGAQA